MIFLIAFPDKLLTISVAKAGYKKKLGIAFLSFVAAARRVAKAACIAQPSPRCAGGALRTPANIHQQLSGSAPSPPPPRLQTTQLPLCHLHTRCRTSRRDGRFLIRLAGFRPPDEGRGWVLAARLRLDAELVPGRSAARGRRGRGRSGGLGATLS